MSSLRIEIADHLLQSTMFGEEHNSFDFAIKKKKKTKENKRTVTLKKINIFVKNWSQLPYLNC